MPEPSKPTVGAAEIFKEGEGPMAGGTNPSGQKIKDFEIKKPEIE